MIDPLCHFNSSIRAIKVLKITHRDAGGRTSELILNNDRDLENIFKTTEERWHPNSVIMTIWYEWNESKKKKSRSRTALIQYV